MRDERTAEKSQVGCHTEFPAVCGAGNCDPYYSGDND